MNFLPSDYEAPKGSNNYMKLQDGENKIRILSQPIIGWEDWIEKKPVRYAMNAKPSKSHDPKKPIRHFWAFIVWNYQEERIQILQITQATIRSSIETLCRDSDWGDPYFYDIKIIRKGEGTDTEYMINPLPHKPVAPRIIEEFKAMPCHLEALFDNADPFSKEWDTYTQGIFEKIEDPKSDLLNADQVKELLEIFEACEPEYPKKLIAQLKKSTGTVENIQTIPVSLYDRIKNAALKKRDEYVAKLAGIEHATA